MPIDTADSIRITRIIKADRQAVWNAFTQPEQMKKWMCPAPNGVKAATADLRVGGAYAVAMEVEDRKHNAFGTYREIEEPRRLVFTWDWREEEMTVGDTVVTVEFNEVDGGTEVVLVHEGFPAKEAAQGHQEGWDACLTHLEGMFA